MDQISWIKSRSVVMRSIDLSDEDFFDLEPFGEMIGNARVVQLGEQCHGDGATFHAKTRLIAYMHQRLGFDVLVWESGIYDCHKAWEAYQRGEDPVAAARLGIFGNWTRSIQMRPMFEYLSLHANSQKPLELAGMDCQLSGEASRRLLPEELLARVSSAAAAPFAAMRKGELPTREQEDAALAEFEEAIAKEEPGFWRQCLKSLSAELRGRGLQRDEGVSAMVQNRDLQMGENLIWFANEGYAGRRIAVWIDSGHASKSFSSMSLPGAEVPNEMHTFRTAGNVVAEALGEENLMVHFTAAEGAAGASEGPPATLGTIPYQVIEPPPPDSFEDLFLQAGFENAVIDLRPRGPEDKWILDRRSMRLGGYQSRDAVWPEIVDLVVFTRVMYPSEAI